MFSAITYEKDPHRNGGRGHNNQTALSLALNKI